MPDLQRLLVRPLAHLAGGLEVERLLVQPGQFQLVEHRPTVALIPLRHLKTFA